MAGAGALAPGAGYGLASGGERTDATRRRWTALVGVSFLALNLQMVTLTGGLASEAAAGPALKAYHAVFVGFSLLLLARARIVRWRAEMVAYFAVTVAATVLAYLHFGVRPIIVNTAFAAYAATVGGTLGDLAGARATARALRWTSVVVLAGVVVKGLLHLPQIVAFLAAPNGHPTLPVFFGGGPNLEATWVALAAAFHLGSGLFVPYVLAAGVVSVAYASRAGFIVCVLALGAAALRSVAARRRRRVAGHRTEPSWGRRLVLLATTAAALAGGGWLAVHAGESIGYVSSRFADLGDDPGSVGRLTLWQGGLEVFVRHPFGVGQGNAVPQIERLIGTALPEDNLHNQYLQHLVETGVQGFTVFVAFALLTWWRLARDGWRDPLLWYASLYLVLAAIQFRGADALFWFVYGLHTGTTMRARSATHAD